MLLILVRWSEPYLLFLTDQACTTYLLNKDIGQLSELFLRT